MSKKDFTKVLTTLSLLQETTLDLERSEHPSIQKIIGILTQKQKHINVKLIHYSAKNLKLKR